MPVAAPWPVRIVVLFGRDDPAFRAESCQSEVSVPPILKRWEDLSCKNVRYVAFQGGHDYILTSWPAEVISAFLHDVLHAEVASQPTAEVLKSRFMSDVDSRPLTRVQGNEGLNDASLGVNRSLSGSRATDGDSAIGEQHEALGRLRSKIVQSIFRVSPRTMHAYSVGEKVDHDGVVSQLSLHADVPVFVGTSSDIGDVDIDSRINDVNFAEMGLGSLEWILIREMLSQMLDVHVPPELVFEGPTVASLARLLLSLVANGSVSRFSASSVALATAASSQSPLARESERGGGERGENGKGAAGREKGERSRGKIPGEEQRGRGGGGGGWGGGGERKDRKDGEGAGGAVITLQEPQSSSLPLQATQPTKGHTFAGSPPVAMSFLAESWVDPSIQLSSQVSVKGPVIIKANAVVKENVILGSGCEIREFAVVGPDVELGAGCVVDMFASVQGDVVLGENCEVGQKAIIQGPIRAGDRNHFQQFAIIGGHSTHLNAIRNGAIIIGSDCVFEIGAAVLSPRGSGTSQDGACSVGSTRLGNRVFVHMRAEVSHDCILEDDVDLVGELAGFCHLMRGAKVMKGVTVHQFTTVGTCSFVAMCNKVRFDVLPYCVFEEDAVVLDNVALRRDGLSLPQINELGTFYERHFSSEMSHYCQSLEGLVPPAVEGNVPWFADELRRFFDIRGGMRDKRMLARFGRARGPLVIDRCDVAQL
eukprot:TRINITY_DN2616_c0_g2_i1.p1 TRINITY_DN2616_c0_g2~~TRINITY_DN2616_c0_g2_i1.p1  ORF type:complete len:737 (-),score=82.14 TRINITY_DN2616_c0_g2_i1:23-2140(-)